MTLSIEQADRLFTLEIADLNSDLANLRRSQERTAALNAQTEQLQREERERKAAAAAAAKQPAQRAAMTDSKRHHLNVLTEAFTGISLDTAEAQHKARQAPLTGAAAVLNDYLKFKL